MTNVVAYHKIDMEKGDNMVQVKNAAKAMSAERPIAFFCDIMCSPSQYGLAEIYGGEFMKFVGDSLPQGYAVVGMTVAINTNGMPAAINEMNRFYSNNPNFTIKNLAENNSDGS